MVKSVYDSEKMLANELRTYYDTRAMICYTTDDLNNDDFNRLWQLYENMLSKPRRKWFEEMRKKRDGA